MATEQQVTDVLRGIRDPESQKDIVTLGLVRDLAVAGDSVSLTLAFAGQPPATKAAMHSMATRLVGQLPGVSRVQVKMGGGAAAAAHAHHAQGPAPSQAGGARPDFIPEVRHTVAVSSGKGGVGKSTVAVNLALALRQSGATVGIIDSDVYGPDVPLMLGAKGRPGMFDNRILPVEAHGLKMMSIGLLVNEREPLVWRGPMIHSFIQQMLKDVMWGPLDYLLFDMPPGTGDAQLSLSQVIPLSGVVMVTTPQDVALLDGRAAAGRRENDRARRPRERRRGDVALARRGGLAALVPLARQARQRDRLGRDPHGVRATGRTGRALHVSAPVPRRRRLLVSPARARGHPAGPRALWEPDGSLAARGLLLAREPRGSPHAG